jgi:hypothetical protein
MDNLWNEVNIMARATSGAMLMDPTAIAGSYSKPYAGSGNFPIPAFNSLVVKLYGAGGGGGTSGYVGGTGSASGFATLHAYGGHGGSYGSIGANGTAVGGDINHSYGGSAGGAGISGGGPGGFGGFCLKTYSPGAFGVGQLVSWNTGSGGIAGNIGAYAGTNGKMVITWT